jgi:cytochrome c553
VKELVFGVTLIFGLTGGTIAYLGASENRSLGFTNICADRGIVCLRAATTTQVVAPEVAQGAKHYTQCAACHGSNGQGGMGPRLAGQQSAMIVDKLTAYKNGETVGRQSNVMWGQSSWMTPQDMQDLGDYIATL